MATHRIKSWRWAAPAVAGALGLAACAGGDPPDTLEVSSGKAVAPLTAAEQYVDVQKNRGTPACEWLSVHAPPTPDSVLVLERCDGEWTGNARWVQPRSVGDG
jgi:hypothetical protein